MEFTKKVYKCIRKAVTQPEPIAADYIMYGLNNENVAKKIERDNTLVFMTAYKATKPIIKAAIEELYGGKVAKVRTLITKRGEKKAYVTMKEEGEAMRIANKAGIA